MALNDYQTTHTLEDKMVFSSGAAGSLLEKNSGQPLRMVKYMSSFLLHFSKE
jgi:hypothetical protein